MTISKEAAASTAKRLAYLHYGRKFQDLPGALQDEMLGWARAGLTAALPFLAIRPAPSQSDERRAHDFANWVALEYRSFFSEQLMALLVVVRAEATLAGAAAEREAWNKLVNDPRWLCDQIALVERNAYPQRARSGRHTSEEVT